ncbi:hypothetical protein E2R68_06295 [Psychromonas sp. RZ22]|uniref:AhpA/YtjB family protein n=1 Tax=Psychromonas algarum TaxID=2555643 RepID=UPI0010683F11|nr:AhpA/YtjB family protein [Psychromonas sp. RZ22]TEW55351.1 hypothetical protein E2R68_06295 [Psychromonas sp. RZ22]
MDNKLFWVVRILQLLTLCILFTVISYQFVSLKSESNAVRYQQTEAFSYSLTNLAAAQATRYLSEKKHKDLQLLMDELSEDPNVRDATIYDQLGQIIYQSKTALPLPVLLRLGDNSIEPEGVIPYIAELYSESTKIGYIRVTLEQKRILSLIYDYQERGFSILMLLIILAFTAGIILMAVFFRKSETAYKQLITEIPKGIERAKNDVAKLTSRSNK